ERNRKPAQSELKRRRQAREDFVEHRLSGGERMPEVALRQISHIGCELMREAFVKAELHSDLLDRLPARRWTREISGGVARQRARKQKGDDDDPDDVRDRLQDAAQDNSAHDKTVIARSAATWRSRMHPVASGGRVGQ